MRLDDLEIAGLKKWIYSEPSEVQFMWGRKDQAPFDTVQIGLVSASDVLQIHGLTIVGSIQTLTLENNKIVSVSRDVARDIWNSLVDSDWEVSEFWKNRRT